MKNYIFKLGKQAKEVSVKSLKLKKKEKVMIDYCNIINKIKLIIIK